MIGRTAGRVERIGRERIRTPSFASKAPIRHLDPTLLVTACLLTGYGLLMVYSASAERLRSEGLSPTLLFGKQVAFAVVGVVAMTLVATFSYRRLHAWGPLIYGAVVFLLLVVMTPIGQRSAGAQRWISLGGFQAQPSEMTKLAVIVMLAGILSERRGQPGPRDVLRCLVLALGPALLIYLQPDLGTILVLLAVTLGMLLVSGTRARLLLVLLLAGAIGFFGILHVGLLREYQVKRLTAFLDPASDPRRTGYNLNQAKIAVGSGQLTGKGLFRGSQTNLDFTPEVHTDFIFTAVGEELGFVGSAALLALFAIYLWRAIRIAMLSKDLLGSILAAGIASMIAFQVFVNVGMTIGVSPITGIPLPFVSYGGSSLLTTFVGTGVLLNIHMRRMT